MNQIGYELIIFEIECWVHGVYYTRYTKDERISIIYKEVLPIKKKSINIDTDKDIHMAKKYTQNVQHHL